MTLHNALLAQVPIQGSLHLLLIQALSRAQSELRTHSGRHPIVGSPKYSDKQEQIPLSHCVLIPQGDGLQASISSNCAKDTNSLIRDQIYKINKMYIWLFSMLIKK